MRRPSSMTAEERNETVTACKDKLQEKFTKDPDFAQLVGSNVTSLNANQTLKCAEATMPVGEAKLVYNCKEEWHCLKSNQEVDEDKLECVES